MRKCLRSTALLMFVMTLSSACKPLARQSGSDISAAKSNKGTLLLALPGDKGKGLCLLHSHTEHGDESSIVEHAKLLTAKGSLDESQIVRAMGFFSSDEVAARKQHDLMMMLLAAGALIPASMGGFGPDDRNRSTEIYPREEFIPPDTNSTWGRYSDDGYAGSRYYGGLSGIDGLTVPVRVGIGLAGGLAVGGVLLYVFHHLKKPQDKGDKEDKAEGEKPRTDQADSQSLQNNQPVEKISIEEVCKQPASEQQDNNAAFITWFNKKLNKADKERFCNHYEKIAKLHGTDANWAINDKEMKAIVKNVKRVSRKPAYPGACDYIKQEFTSKKS